MQGPNSQEPSRYCSHLLGRWLFHFPPVSYNNSLFLVLRQLSFLLVFYFFQTMAYLQHILQAIPKLRYNLLMLRAFLRLQFKSGEDYCTYCQAVSASVRIAASKENEERKEDIWRKVAGEAARNYGTANGLIKRDNEWICIVGTRPW